MRNGVAISAIVLLASGQAFGQDNHRWTNQFGTRSALMGGAVVGGVRDSSASFYNPGALGFVDDASIGVSANAIRYESLERKNIVSEGVGFDGDDIKAIPLMVSGVYIDQEAPDWVLGYTILSKNSTSYNATERLNGAVDSIQRPDFPGLEDTIVQASQHNDLNEIWGGLGLSYRVNDNISVGFTNFLALRSQEASQVNQVRAVNQDLLTVSTLDTTKSYDYWNLRALWKFGVAGQWDGFRAGLTLTTPSVTMTGDGTSFRDYTANNVDLGEGLPSGVVASDRQDGLDAEYRSPVSVALGAEVDVTSSTKLAATVEWFDSLGKYSVLDPESRAFLRPQGAYPGLDSNEFLNVLDQADGILNFGIAVEQGLAENWNGYLAFRSDYATFDWTGENTNQIGFSNYDLWHITTGVTYKRERSTLALGVEYSYGNSDEISRNKVNTVENEYTSLAVILGYTYHFGDIVTH